MSAAIPEFSFARDTAAGPVVEERVRLLLHACEHYNPSDRPLFTAAYRELCREDLNGKKVVELCCGYGELSRQLARAFPGADLTALDRYPEAGRALVEAKEKGELPNARYVCGDALRLREFADGSVDLIFGQATLHHLAHDAAGLRDECARALRPGGRLIFIFEPFGHNPLWAMIRAWRIARAQMTDESNLVLPQLAEIGRAFSRCEVQPFNLLGYPFKSLGRLAGGSLMRGVDRLDTALMRRHAGLAKLAANFNVVFTK